MAVSNTLVVGTIGYGVFRSENDGKDWERSNFTSGLPFGTRVFYLVSHPHKPEIIFAGTDFGLARSDDGGKRWQIGEDALKNFSVWADSSCGSPPNCSSSGSRLARALASASSTLAVRNSSGNIRTRDLLF